MPSRFLSFVYVEDQQEHSSAFLKAFAQTRVTNDIILLRTIGEVREFFTGAAERKDVPALSLVTLSFTGMKGLEVIQWIRGFVQLKTMPLVALSSGYDFDEMEQSYDRGANLYLIKPGNVREWADLVFRLQGYWSGQSDAPIPEFL